MKDSVYKASVTVSLILDESMRIKPTLFGGISVSCAGWDVDLLSSSVRHTNSVLSSNEANSCQVSSCFHLRSLVF